MPVKGLQQQEEALQVEIMGGFIDFDHGAIFEPTIQDGEEESMMLDILAEEGKEDDDADDK